MNEVLGFGNRAADVRKQLLKIAREMKRPTQELLQYYVMERFLYRLSSSPYAETFILKGGLLFSVWNLSGFLATQDIDFLGLTNNNPEHIAEICKQICLVHCNDGVLFDQETVLTSIVQPQNEYQGVRIKFKGSIDRSIVHMRIDVGFKDVVYPNPIPFSFPTILEMPTPNVLGYTQESVIAEKVVEIYPNLEFRLPIKLKEQGTCHVILKIGEMSMEIKNIQYQIRTNGRVWVGPPVNIYSDHEANQKSSLIKRKEGKTVRPIYATAPTITFEDPKIFDKDKEVVEKELLD